MKVIIAGSREITDQNVVSQAIISSSFVVSEVVSGTARGVDQLGEKEALKLGIPIKQFPADWNRWGKAAGYYRNQEMAEYADALIAIWDGKSRGTKDTIERAEKAGIPVEIIYA